MNIVRRYWGVFAVIAIFAGASVLSTYLLVRTSVIVWQTQRSSDWLVSQLELEYTKSLNLLDAFYRGDPALSAESVKERFDIFESRITAIATGKEGSELRETKGYPALMSLLTPIVSKSQSLIKTTNREDRTQYLAVRQDFVALGQPIHAWAMDVLLHNQALETLQRTFYLGLAARLGVLCTGIVLIWMLSRAIFRAEKLVLAERAARERADHANRAKDTFLAIASHEFRTPLNAIIGFSELLHSRASTLTEESQKRFLEDVLSNGRHLARIVDDTLSMSKISTGKLVLKLERLDIRAVINGCLSSLQGSARDLGISLNCPMPQEPILVLADSVWLSQAFNNIVSNALRFSVPGESVDLTCHQRDRSVVVDVVDRGIGIPESELLHVTKAFYQVQNVLDREQGGLGLGLAIATGVIEAHGGNLAISSSLGRGTVVSVSLPKIGPQDDAAQSRKSHIDLGQF